MGALVGITGLAASSHAKPSRPEIKASRDLLNSRHPSSLRRAAHDSIVSKSCGSPPHYD